MSQGSKFIFRSFETSSADVYHLESSETGVTPVKVGSIVSGTANEGNLLKVAYKQFPDMKGLSLANIKTTSKTYKITKEAFIANGEELVKSEKEDEKDGNK